MSDMKVKALGSRFYYPDVMAVCDESDADDYIKERPCLSVEVLSRATAGTDRREKVDAYLSLPSLQSLCSCRFADETDKRVYPDT